MATFSRDIEIDASPEEVWQVLNDVQTWPHWFPAVDAVSDVNGNGAGTTFRWRDNDQEGTGRIASAEPHERFEVSTQLGTDQDMHLFELKPDRNFLGIGKSGRTDVTYTLDTLSGGGILGRFIASGNPLDARRVKSAMERLKRYVETQA